MATKEFVLKLQVDTGNGNQEIQKVAKNLGDFDKLITELNKEIRATDFGTAKFTQLNGALAQTRKAKQEIVDAAKKESEALNNNTEALNTNSKGFIALSRQIRETRKELQAAEAAGNEAGFKKLKGQLDELEDSLELTTLKSKQFDDALAGIPGPVGQIGQGIKGLDMAFKVLVANPVVAILTALVGLLSLFRESLTKTTEGQETLNRISAAFGKIIGPIFAIIEKVALPLFEGFAFVLEKVAQGFGRFAKFLGISEGKIAEASKNSSEVLKNEADKQAEIEKQKTEKLKAEQEKRAEEQKRRAEEYKKNVEETQKAVTAYEEEGSAARRSARDNEIANETAKFEALKAQAIKYGQDIAGITTTYREKVDAINKKYDADELQARLDNYKKLQDEQVKNLENQKTEAEKQRKLSEQQQKTQLDIAIKTYGQESEQAKNAQGVLDTIRKQNIQADILALEQKRERTTDEKLLLEQLKQSLVAFGETYDEQKQKETQIDQTRFQNQQALLGATANALVAVGDLVGRETKAGKATAAAASLINTYTAIAGQLAAFSKVPVPAYAIVQAIATGLVGFKAVRDIYAVDTSDTGSNSAPTAGSIRPRGLARGGVLSGPGSGTSDSIPALLSSGETIINAKSSKIFRPLLSTINSIGGGRRFAAGGVADLGSMNDFASRELARATDQISQPQKVYVVANDMTNQQMFERAQKARSTI